MPRGKYIGAKISSPSPLLVGRAGVNLETLNMNCYLLLQIRSLSTHDLSETFFSICDKWCWIEEIQNFSVSPEKKCIWFCNTLAIKKYHVFCKYSKIVVYAANFEQLGNCYLPVEMSMTGEWTTFSATQEQRWEQISILFASGCSVKVGPSRLWLIMVLNLVPSSRHLSIKVSAQNDGLWIQWILNVHWEMCLLEFRHKHVWFVSTTKRIGPALPIQWPLKSWFSIPRATIE